MSGRTLSYTTAGAPAIVPPPAGERWPAKLGLLLLAVVLLSLSFAPVKQLYLAWVGLAPWLLLLARTKSNRAAFFWSWFAGTLFFAANMWWLVYVTGPGMAALVAVLGLYWAVAGLIIRATGLLGSKPAENEAKEVPRPGALRIPLFGRVVLIAAVWVALEWLRGTWPLQGLPWLYLGHTQSPALPLCQVADVTGVFGISFWVAMVNAWVAFAVLYGWSRRVALAGAGVLACVVLVLAYGVFRYAQTPRYARPGPTVMVVQPDIPQSNNGSKGEPPEDILKFHLGKSAQTLASHPGTDLVVWSETMMPPLNPGARAFIRQRVPAGMVDFFDVADEQIGALARESHTAFLVGGLYWDHLSWRDGDQPVAADRRNTAFLYEPSGELSAQRYDKIHLVPFGEFLPFKDAIPPLYRLFLALSPYTDEYTLTAGDPAAMTIFPLKGGGSAEWRFVSPICFEDIDAGLVRRMFKPEGRAWHKRADFLVNITNDGWFKGGEMAQHLQASQFRAIENRVPMARSVNTGISGFIDSLGRTDGLVPAGAEGASVRRLTLDSRQTFYTRFGDVFAFLCVGATLGLAATVAAATFGLARFKSRRASAIR